MSEKHTSLRSRLSSKQKKGIIALAVVLVLGCGVAGVVYYFMPKETIPASEASDRPSDEDIATSKANVEQSVSDGELRQEAFDNVNNKNTDAAGKSYERAIAAETSQERKTTLAIDLSGVYYAAGEYDKAFAAMKDVEASNPDKFLVADWLSRLYEDRKDYQQAARYYRLAGEWASSSQNKTGLSKAFYDSEAARVSKIGSGN